MKKVIAILCALLCVTVIQAADISLHKQGSATQLYVDGKPFVILGGELGNSSASSPADIARIFPKLQRMNLNTVLVPVYWDMVEPVEGNYDFSLIDATLDEARRCGLKVVFLWFGAWKNSMSCYAPSWFKSDYKKYPRAYTSEGKPLEIASAFSENVYQADSRAFKAWLSHLADVDKEGTVLMVQIENEIGMLEDARDYSAAAQREYDKGVPSQLIAFLEKNKKSIHPQLLERWRDNGMKRAGSWREVFGDDIYSDEYFMAWNYAAYVERLAREARDILGRPLYVNAAMNSRGRKPGEYPSAGPLAHLKDIWHAAAPTVDILSPDLYDKGFTDWVAQYHTSDNPLFIPEIRRFDGNAAQAYYVIGEHDAIGISPFSIENGSDSPQSTPGRGYAALRDLMPLLVKYQGKGIMNGFYFDNDSTERILRHDGLKITANHYFTLPWDPRATDGSEWMPVGGVIIRLAPDEYIIAGTGIVVKFENETESGVKRNLGEDGFLNAGSDRNAAPSWGGGMRAGLASVDEVAVNPDGTLRFVRRYNGDETHQGRHVRIGVDDFQVLHVKLYQYK
ncbi:MAG: DUF5597 domain-containing protein [Candidatus Homeothermus sp.]|nr:DUF5597 domain-containing protein [Candidatus Homeothermus sp.]